MRASEAILKANELDELSEAEMQGHSENVASALRETAAFRWQAVMAQFPLPDRPGDQYGTDRLGTFVHNAAEI